MSTVIQPTALNPLPPAGVPSEPIYRLSVDQYHAMVRAGILTSEDKVELLEGWLYPKMTRHPPHSTGTRLTRKALEGVLCEGWFVDSQEAITTEDSEPEPDTAVIRGTIRDYVDRHPGPGDVGMIVEVADSSVARDRGVKRRVYSRARIPIYWIVNIPEQHVEVYSEPAGSGDDTHYAQRKDYGINDDVPVILDGKEIGRIAVRDLLP